MNHNLERDSKIVYIVLSVYNWEKYFLEQLMSIYYQNYTNWFLIIVDDWSTDSSYQIAENFIKNYDLNKKVKIIKQENQWTCKAIEKWLIEVQEINKWDNLVALCDADDIWTRDKLETQVKHMQKNKECDLCYHDLAVISKDWELTKLSAIHNAIPLFKWTPFINTFFDFGLLNHISTTEMMFRTLDIKNIIPIENSWAKDYRIVCIFSYMKKNIQFIDKKLWYYRRWHSSIRTNLNSNWYVKNYQRDLDMMKLLYQRFNKDKEIEYFIKFHESRVELAKKWYSQLTILFLLWLKYPRVGLHFFKKIILSLCKYWL